jgi:ABC-type multidrug transport system fused ATPase/permease subunit
LLIKTTIQTIKQMQNMGDEATQDDILWGCLLVALTALNILFSVFVNKHKEQYVDTKGDKAVNLLRTVIYKKLGKVSGATNKKFAEGQIIELMNTDAHKAEEIFDILSGVCKIPTNTVFSAYMLTRYFGVSFFISLVPFSLSFLSKNYFSRQRKALQKEMKVARDAMSNDVNEILTNAKMLKLYGWTDQFKLKILRAREEYYRQRARLMRLDSYQQAMNTMFHGFIPATCFASFIYMGGEIDLATATISLTYLDKFIWTQNWVTNTRSQYHEMDVSFSRI